MGGLIQYPHVFYYWKRYSRRLYPPSAYGLGGLDMLHVVADDEADDVFGALHVACCIFLGAVSSLFAKLIDCITTWHRQGSFPPCCTF